MLALRLQQLRGLARLAQLGQAAGAIPGWQQQAAAALHASSGRWAADSSGSGGGITGWLTSKLAGPLSGMMGKGDIEDLDLETFAKSIKQVPHIRKLEAAWKGSQVSCCSPACASPPAPPALSPAGAAPGRPHRLCARHLGGRRRRGAGHDAHV